MGWGDDHRHRGALRLVECWGDDVPQGKLMPAPWLHQRRREPIVIMGCRIELAHAFQRYAMNREDALLEDWRARALALESAVKHVVQHRMKQSGMRWRSVGADSMLSLRAIYRSTDAWDRFLAFKAA